MKNILLGVVTFFYINSSIAQGYNDIPIMPNTINVKIMQPMKPVEPVNYGKLSSNLASDLNDISESREAQKAAFEKMTFQAINDIQSSKSLGYSSSLNDKMNLVQQMSIKNIRGYYSSLTNGLIDPNDYANLLNIEVNNYLNFAQLMNEININFKNTIDELKTSNKYEQISSLTNIIDNNCTQTKIESTYQYGQKTKRYSYYYNQEIVCNKNGSYLSISDFFSSINAATNNIKNIQFTEGAGKLNNEIKLDISTLEKVEFTNTIFKVPSTFKLMPNSNSNWEKTYSDGTKVMFTHMIDQTQFKKDFKNNVEALEKFKSLNSIEVSSLPSIGIKNDLNFVITELIAEQSAFYSELKVGDKIIAIDDVEISHDSLIAKSKIGKVVGDTLKFKVLRSGVSKEVLVVLKSRDHVITSFDITLNNKSGYLFAVKNKFFEYGELINRFSVFSVVPYNESLYYFNFLITPSPDQNTKSNMEIFKDFKPLIKAINDTVIFR